MRKHLLSLFSMLLLAAMPALAGINIGYTDGQIATNATGIVTGLSGTNATIQETVFITPDMLKAYQTCQITSVNVGLANGASAYPEEVTAWVRADRTGENIASGTAAAVGGWTAVQLDKALNISDYAETGVWVGFTFVQSKKMNVIALLSSAAADNTGWLCKNGSWTNYSTKGALPIEAIVEGDDLPTHDLAISSAEVSPKLIKIGNPVKVKAVIRNNASVTAVNPQISYNILNGAATGTVNTNVTIAYREKKTVTFEIPGDFVNEECDGKVNLELLWADGSADDNIADNTVSLNVTFANDVMYKRMLVEEGTGAWCGFCVRGIVGLREMREKYPDTFIGIGVHNGDSYTVSAYDSWMCSYIDGFPSCLINRDGKVYDPSFDELEDYYKNMDNIATADIEVSAQRTADGLILKSNTTFATSEDDASYNIVYVLREDQCPINQSNYYSGGGYGPMGGFESMGGHPDILIDDVARGVYPAPKGEAIDLPASIVKGTPYAHTLTAANPSVLDWTNANVVAILIDNATGKVVNAAVGKVEDVVTGIESIQTKSEATGAIYNIAGQRVGKDYKGIKVINGKKVL